MDEFIPEARVDFGIEYLFEPINYDFVSIRVAKLLMVGKPQIHVIIDPEINWDERHAESSYRRRQKPDPGASFDSVENRDAGICRYANDPFQLFQS